MRFCEGNSTFAILYICAYGDKGCYAGICCMFNYLCPVGIKLGHCEMTVGIN